MPQITLIIHPHLTLITQKTGLTLSWRVKLFVKLFVKLVTVVDSREVSD